MNEQVPSKERDTTMYLGMDRDELRALIGERDAEIESLQERVNDLLAQLAEKIIGDGSDAPQFFTNADGAIDFQPVSTHEPSPARKPDKFDLAFEIMRQLEAEDMETMQSCQFGFVMRVTREGTGCGQVEFRPIASAPKDGSTILLRCPKGIVEGCWEQVDGGGHPENGPPIYWWTSPFTEFIDGPYDAPTHWALIPRDALTKGAEAP
jgi:hypothetical protein